MSEISLFAPDQDPPLGALVAARRGSEPGIDPAPRAVSAQQAAARRELPDLREQVGSLREENARLILMADSRAAICQAIDGQLTHMSTADSSTRSRRAAHEQPA
ncbi:MAG: hypothetical protein ACLP8S_06335 [Solirubrobacteraceae bacterium]